jgi:protein-S-isoprenylcysteine O-methyltransferase Ste14
MVLAGSIFLVGLPVLVVVAGRALDEALGVPPFSAGLVTSVPGVLLVVAGGVLGAWSVLAEATVGHGTPVPLIPTQRLVVVPPFTYCRNPMVLGTSLAYLGVGVCVGSVSAVVLVVLFATLLLLYVKLVEEKELEARFGAEYAAYKRTTPFLLPRLVPRR